MDWIEQISREEMLLGMGHGQSEETGIGLGWLYYALARVEQPGHVLCIGSWRGFVPIVLARALKDNAGGARLTFVDPSLVDDFWTEAQRVTSWFASFGVDNIDHYCLTTDDFARTEAFQTLPQIGLLFIDGYHTAEQARLDHTTFLPKLTDSAVVLFHDSIRERTSDIYGRERRYLHTVHEYMKELKRDPAYQVMDFALGSGVTAVRRNNGAARDEP